MVPLKGSLKVLGTTGTLQAQQSSVTFMGFSLIKFYEQIPVIKFSNLHETRDKS